MAAHRVRRQAWHIRARSAEEAFALRREARDAWQPALLAALERAFDDAAGDERVLRIPRLHLQLRLPPGEGGARTEGLVQQAQEALARELARVGELLAAPAGAAEAPGASPRGRWEIAAGAAEARLALEHYLRTGRLPWQASGPSRDAIAAGLERAAAGALPELLPRLLAEAAPAPVWFRLLQLLDAGAALVLIDAVRPPLPPPWREALRALAGGAAPPEVVAASRHARLELAAVLLAAAAAGAAPDSTASLIAAAAAGDEAAAGARARLLQAIVDASAHHVQGAARGSASDPESMRSGDVRGNGPGRVGPPQPARAPAADAAAPTGSAVGLSGSEDDDARPGVLPAARERAPGEAHQGGSAAVPPAPAATELARASEGEDAVVQPGSAAGTGAASAGAEDGAQAAARTPAQYALGAPDLSAPPAAAGWEARAGEALETPFGERIASAGLVLLHPFLPAFLEHSGVRRGRSIAPEQLPRAAALLHYLASAREEVLELELVLVKVLLGLRPEAPLPLAEGLLGQGDHDECDALLGAVVQHWGALGSTSPAGLRASFLQRDGLLYEEEHGWRLRVEPASFDVLLSRLPWSISVVRLPWMPEPIYAEWPTG